MVNVLYMACLYIIFTYGQSSCISFERVCIWLGKVMAGGTVCVITDTAVIAQYTGLDSLSFGHGPGQFSHTSMNKNVNNV